MVAAQNEHIFGRILPEKRKVLIYCVRGARIPFAAAAAYIRREHIYAAAVAVKVPRGAVAQICVQLQRGILRKHAHGINVRIYAV